MMRVIRLKKKLISIYSEPGIAGLVLEIFEDRINKFEKVLIGRLKDEKL